MKAKAAAAGTGAEVAAAAAELQPREERDGEPFSSFFVASLFHSSYEKRALNLA